MTHYLELFVSAALIENILLTFFLGICTAIAVSRSMTTAIGSGFAIIVVQTVTVPVNHLIHRFLLGPGALSWAGWPESDLSYLALIVYISVIAAVVQILEMIIDRYFPVLYQAMGLFLPLITVNCAVLGGTLFSEQRGYALDEAVVFGLGTGAGWALAVVLLAGIREKLKYSDIPVGLRGTGITFMIMGLMAMVFMGFSGMAQG